MTKLETCTVAAVQAAPIFLDRDATVQTGCNLIAEAAGNGARLVVFPEAFIPTYPDWVWAVPPGNGGVHARLYTELLANSVTIPDESTEQLCRAARQAGVHVVMGVSERNAEASGSSLYNTLLYIDHHGQILGKHRKLVPTAAERLVWAPGDGSTLAAYDTPFGKLGGLICWENYMPLARYAMYAWGTQIYVAATWDCSDTWLATLRHIAKEGGAYVIGCCIAMRKSDIPEHFDLKDRFYAGADDWINVGNSAIVDPNGNFLAGPLAKEEGILYAEIELRQVSGSKWMLDVAGHYSRPDVFELILHDEARLMIRNSHGAQTGDEVPTNNRQTLPVQSAE
jgi:nitrilase